MILDGISIDYFKQFKVTTCVANMGFVSLYRRGL